MVQVDGARVIRTRFPEMGDRLAEQAQHSPYSLEALKSCRLLRQRLKHCRVKRIAGAEILDGRRSADIRGQGFLMKIPALSVGLDDCFSACVVNGLEEASAQHLGRFLLAGGIQNRGFAGRDLLELLDGLVDISPRRFQGIGNQLVLLAERIDAPSFLADRQRIDQRDLRLALHRLVKRTQERRKLAVGLRLGTDLPKIDGQLVQQNQSRLVAQETA